MGLADTVKCSPKLNVTVVVWEGTDCTVVTPFQVTELESVSLTVMVATPVAVEDNVTDAFPLEFVVAVVDDRESWGRFDWIESDLPPRGSPRLSKLRIEIVEVV